MGWMDRFRGKIGASQAAPAAGSPAVAGGLTGQMGMPQATAPAMAPQPAFADVMKPGLGVSPVQPQPGAMGVAPSRPRFGGVARRMGRFGRR
jgi:hypothetical protein